MRLKYVFMVVIMLLCSACSSDSRVKILQEQKRTLESLYAQVKEIIATQEEINILEQKKQVLSAVDSVSLSCHENDAKSSKQEDMESLEQEENTDETQRQTPEQLLLSQMEKDGELKPLKATEEDMCVAVAQAERIERLQDIMKELESKKKEMRRKEQIYKK